jgi:hypothetical protein
MKNILIFSLLAFFATACNLFNSKSPIDSKLIPVKSGEKWGYILKDGKIEINPQFEQAEFFSNEGLALVKLNDKFGFISKDGKFAINPTYIYASSFSEQLACVVLENGKPQFINSRNEIVVSNIDADYCGSFINGMARIIKIDEMDKWKYGFIDKNGKVVISPMYESALNFSNGLSAVSKKSDKGKETLWGYIDTEGKVVINFQFQSAGSFYDDLAPVSNGKQYGFIDKTGKYAINPQFEEVSRFQNGLAVFKQGKNYGFIDKQGKIIINPQFLEAYPFSDNDLALVKSSDEKWGFISKDGKYAINPQFESAFPFLNDYAITISSGKMGIVDEKGQFLVNPQYETLDDLSILSTLISTTFDPIEHAIMNRSGLAKSDYFDATAVSAKILKLLADKHTFSLTSNTTLAEIRSMYPNSEYVKENNVYKPKFENKIVQNVVVKELSFTFKKPIAEFKPIYRVERRYSSYYYQYVNERVFDHYETTYKNSETIRLITCIIALEDNFKEKAAQLAKQIKSGLTNNKNFTEIDINIRKGIDKDDKKALYAFKNINTLYMVQGGEGFVLIMSFLDSSEFENTIERIKVYAEEYLKKEVVTEKELEEKRIADSIRVADSLAMMQAEQQRIADSIARAQQN